MLKAKLKLSKQDLDLILNQRKTKLLKNLQTQYFDLKIFQNLEIIIEKDLTKNLEKDSRINNSIISFKSSIIISKKTFKKSVERNKVRRRFYSILEKYLQNNKDNFSKNLNLIFYPKKESLNIKFLVLQQEVYNILESNLFF